MFRGNRFYRDFGRDYGDTCWFEHLLAERSKHATLVTWVVKQNQWHSCQGRHWHHPAGIEVLASTRSVSADDEMENWVIGIFGPDNAQSFRIDCEAFTVKVRCASLGVSRGLEASHDCLSRIFTFCNFVGVILASCWRVGLVHWSACAFYRDAPGQPLSMAGFVWQFQTTCTRGPALELTVISDPRKRHAQIRRKNQEQVLARSWPSSRRLWILALRSLDLVSDFFLKTDSSKFSCTF